MSADDLASTLAAIAEDLAVVDARGPDERADLRSATARFVRVVDVLVARGVLRPGDARLLDRLGEAAKAPIVRLSMVRDKHRIPSPPIDCAKYLHLCQARCCALKVTLSPVEVQDHKLRWDLDQPYELERGDDGQCVHLAAGGGCDSYDERPAACREYDCREDRRVWIDFEQQLPAPMPEGVKPRF